MRDIEWFEKDRKVFYAENTGFHILNLDNMRDAKIKGCTSEENIRQATLNKDKTKVVFGGKEMCIAW